MAGGRVALFLHRVEEASGIGAHEADVLVHERFVSVWRPGHESLCMLLRKACPASSLSRAMGEKMVGADRQLPPIAALNQLWIGSSYWSEP